jgi:hypothetical protein
MAPGANGAGGGGPGEGGTNFAPGAHGYMNPAPGAPVHTQSDPAKGYNPLFPFFSPAMQMPYEAPTPPKEMQQRGKLANVLDERGMQWQPNKLEGSLMDAYDSDGLQGSRTPTNATSPLLPMTAPSDDSSAGLLPALSSLGLGDSASPVSTRKSALSKAASAGMASDSYFPPVSALLARRASTNSAAVGGETPCHSSGFGSDNDSHAKRDPPSAVSDPTDLRCDKKGVPESSPKGSGVAIDGVVCRGSPSSADGVGGMMDGTDEASFVFASRVSSSMLKGGSSGGRPSSGTGGTATLGVRENGDTRRASFESVQAARELLNVG